MTRAIEEVYATLSSTWVPDELADPIALFADKRIHEPVMAGDLLVELGIRTNYHGPGAPKTFTVFRYDDIAEVLRDADTYSSEVYMDIMKATLGRVILGMGGNEHRFWRRLLSPVFGLKALADWESEFARPVADRMVAEFAPGKRCDLLGFALGFPLQMIYAMFGFEDDPEQFARFVDSAHVLMIGAAAISETDTEAEKAAKRRRSTEAAQEMYESMLVLVRERRAEGARGKDLISGLVAAEADGQALDNDQIVVFLRSLVIAATENTSRQFANTMFCLLEHLEVLERVRADRSLVSQTVIEALRLQPPSKILPRVATRDTELRGVKIPKGSAVHTVLLSGNRDPEAFANPDTFDIDRDQKPMHLSFGFGPHICAGMHVARAEIHSAINAVLDQLPNVRFDPDEDHPTISGLQYRGPLALPVVWD